ncbi:MAG: SpoIIE family protein phosphatase [Ignavibacteriaceae bacterium]|nr:SpoIIE family protein phosphatase [Ignavibacteriaceae bacterium]
MKSTFFYVITISQLSLFPITSLIGQNKYNFEHISIPDGLSNAQVWDIKQDQYGFLWIATSDGLNSYDGYNFKIYRNDPGDQNSLPDNTVNSLMIDHDGTLWVGTSAGFSKFNRTNESFETMLPDSNSVDPFSNNITKIVQDSKNRIWLLSDNGVFMSDKNMNKIKQEFLKDGEKKSRVRVDNFAFLETSSGEIYAGYHFKGLIKYNESDKLFEWINVDPKNPTVFEHHSLLNLYEDKTGKIWISSQNGFYSYDPQTGSFTEINLFQKVSVIGEAWTNGVSGVYQDDKGFLWIATITNGIFLYDMKTNEIITLNEAELPVGVHNFNGFWKLYRDEFGILWIGTINNGLLKLDFQKEPFRLFTNPIDKTNANKMLFISSIYKTNNEKDFIWLGTDEGLIKYGLKDKTHKKYQNINRNQNSINDNSVRSIRQGFSQELWLGARTGLSKMNLLNNTFTNYDLSDNSKYIKVNYNNVYDLSMDDYGDLWIASNLAGVVKLDTKNNTKQFIPTQDFRTYDIKLITAVDSLSKNNYAAAKLTEVGDLQDLKKEFSIQKQTDVMIVSVGEGATSPGMMDYGWLQDSKSDTIWIDNDYSKSFYVGGNYKNRIHIGIISLKKGDYTLRYISDEGHSYGKWNADPPSDSSLWGIQVFDLTSSDVNYYKNLVSSSENHPSINSLFVRKVEYQNDGSVLIGTNTGLYKYDIRKKSIENLQSDSKIFGSQNLIEINDILVDKDNVAWIATNGGLIKYDQQSNKFKILYDKDGLPSNYIKAIEEDLYGNLWLSTLNGISKFNKDTDHPIFINYDVRDGLQGYAFNNRASFRSESGDLFFAGQNGFNTFHSSNINKQLPKIEITQLKISNKLVTPSSENSPLTKSIPDTKNIELTYSQNSISFEFTAIHFSSPEKNQYAYMLEGFDKNGWIYDNRRFATYTNLPPGDYVFKVKGSNGDGVWDETGATINIKVLAPWWRTIWAYIMYFFVFASGIFIVDRVQRRRLLAKANEQAKFQEAEIRAQIAETENERKTKELEEARQLQLSMLPKTLPQLPHLDIAVYMKTATEVGGDYYDFNVAMDGTLTVVLGDATGHGMRAGTMVTSAKSLFNSYAANPDILFTFREMTRCIKQMQFQSLAMSMMMLKIKNNKLLMSSAGMPPVYLFRNKHKIIEEYLIEGMPLGTMDNFPYELKEMELFSGDTILLMSDGFPELQNSNNEMFGYRRARNSFEEVAEKEPEGIISYLKEEGSRWSNDKEPDDDVTFVVLKVK